MLKKISIAGLILLTMHLQVAAQNAVKPMTLKECIDYTLRENPNNEVYTNQVKMAEQQKIEGRAYYLPQINATGTLDDNLKRQVTVIPAGAFSPVDLKVQFGNQYNTAVNLQADQVIYDQTLIEGIRANKPNIEIAELKKEKNEDDLIYSTAAAYYQVLTYKEQVKLLSENEKKFSELSKVQKLQLDKGVITKVTYNRVLVNYNNILSQRKVAETNYELSLNKLKNAMGVPVQSNIVIEDSINYKQEVTLPAASDLSVQSKPDYRILEKNIRLQEIDYRRKKASMLPTLNAYARYGANAFGNDFIDSYKQWYDYSSVGLKLNVPIFSSGKRYSQIQQSKLSLMNSRQNLEISSESLQLQLENSNTQLINSYNNLQSNKNNLTLAQEVFNDTNLQYQNGAASLTDFLNSDYAYKEAQANYVNSLLNYLVTRIELERSKGTIKTFVNQL